MLLSIYLIGDSQAAAPRYLHVGARELSDELLLGVEDGHVEPVSVRVADDYIAGGGDVDPVGKRRHALVPYLGDERTILVDDDDGVALKNKLAYSLLTIA